jgi:hypothetical protein
VDILEFSTLINFSANFWVKTLCKAVSKKQLFFKFGMLLQPDLNLVDEQSVL